MKKEVERVNLTTGRCTKHEKNCVEKLYLNVMTISLDCVKQNTNKTEVLKSINQEKQN
jgi:hypothetical protein